MTKPSFFIFSLPRSGSSWLSLFFSHNGSFCYHEPLCEGSLLALTLRCQNRPESCCGAIDTTAHDIADTVKKEYPHAKFLVLLRDPKQIYTSAISLGVEHKIDPIFEMERLLKATRGFRVIQHEYMFDVDYLEDLWGYVVGTKFDWERAEYLVEMNIQRSFPAVRARLAKRKAS